MNEQFCPSEEITLELTKHIKKGAVYSLAELRRRVLNSNLPFKDDVINMYVNNHVSFLTSKGFFKKISIGHYKFVASKDELKTYIMEKHYARIGAVVAEVELPGLISQQPINEDKLKIQELENKLNIVAAAFCSIGRKLQTNTDLHKILIETGERIESVMS